MSSASVQKLSKPQLRGLFRSFIRKHIAIALVCGMLTSVAWKYGILEPRKRAYAEFYRTYDAEADYQRMMKAGVLPPFPTID
ncbi:Cytochrome c oxidase subunit 6C, partial [Stegodyphus mimosarum]